MDAVKSAVVTADPQAGSAPAEAEYHPDPQVLQAARQAAAEESGAPELVGDHLGSHAEDDVAVSVRFATTDPGYVGWAWCVTVATVEPSSPTISEVVLLPGPDSLLAPAWLPWNERVRPGDLGPGDLLPPAVDDPRLVPAYVASDDPAVEELAVEIGLGRVRVLSRLGRVEAAERWHGGTFGPDSEIAKAAPATCVWCAFYLPLAGSLGATFGACGNEMSPADGRVVDAGFGCGAHSELVVELPPTGLGDNHIDELLLDVHQRPPVAPDLGTGLLQAAELIEEEIDADDRPASNTSAEVALEAEVVDDIADDAVAEDTVVDVAVADETVAVESVASDVVADETVAGDTDDAQDSVPEGSQQPATGDDA
jgi:Protein of unknown function (DUF3027)